MEKSVDYYMELPYTVELELGKKEYRASVKELPGCRATAKATESVEELWERLKEGQRRRIEELLGLGYEVPEPTDTRVDPFWENLPDGLDGEETETILYGDGASFFPLRVLVELWFRELQGVGLAKVAPAEPPPKGGLHHLDQLPHARGGDLRPVHLGKGRRVAWIRLDGPRTGRGYSDVSLLD